MIGAIIAIYLLVYVAIAIIKELPHIIIFIITIPIMPFIVAKECLNEGKKITATILFVVWGLFYFIVSMLVLLLAIL